MPRPSPLHPQPSSRSDLFRIHGAVSRDPAIDAWLATRPAPLAPLAQDWFTALRDCGDEVRESMHDGCPTACLGDVPFAYVGVYTSHVSIGFFQGAALPDPARLLLGTGKRMRHVKLQPGQPANTAALHHLIEAAWSDIKARVENG